MIDEFTKHYRLNFESGLYVKASKDITKWNINKRIFLGDLLEEGLDRILEDNIRRVVDRELHERSR
jgi:hypothetical protein